MHNKQIRSMQYNNFIQSSIARIRNSRQNLASSVIPVEITPSLSTYFGQSSKDVKTLLGHSLKSSSSNAQYRKQPPANMSLHVYADKNNQLFKLEQWNFKCLKNLVQSEYQSNQDSELDQVQVQQKSYFRVLQQKLLKFAPKAIIKDLQPNKIIIEIVKQAPTGTSPSSSPLKKNKRVHEQQFYLVTIGQYEGNGFSCQVSLQAIQGEVENIGGTSYNFGALLITGGKNYGQKQIKLYSSQQQFQVLEDSAYQKQKKQKQKQQQKLKKQEHNTTKINSNPIIEQKTQQKQPEMSGKQQTDLNKQKSHNSQKQLGSHAQPSQHGQQPMSNYLYISKYSTKQFSISNQQKKVAIIKETIQMIQDSSIGTVSIGQFINKLDNMANKSSTS